MVGTEHDAWMAGEDQGDKEQEQSFAYEVYYNLQDALQALEDAISSDVYQMIPQHLNSSLKALQDEIAWLEKEYEL